MRTRFAYSVLVVLGYGGGSGFRDGKGSMYLVGG